MDTLDVPSYRPVRHDLSYSLNARTVVEVERAVRSERARVVLALLTREREHDAGQHVAAAQRLDDLLQAGGAVRGAAAAVLALSLCRDGTGGGRFVEGIHREAELLLLEFTLEIGRRIAE